MKIHIKGIEDDRFQRPLGLIANLFFEESEVVLGSTAAEPDATIEFDVKDKGTILVNSESGKGTEFIVSLPKL